MNSTLRLAAVGAVVVLSTTALLFGACGESRKISGGGAPPPGSELNLEIQGLKPPAQGTDATVTFRATDRNGSPIDLLAELGNAAAKTLPYVSNGPRFVLSQLEPDGSYTNLFEAPKAAAEFTPPDGSPQTPDRTATQPNFDPPSTVKVTDRLTANGNGVYVFQFSPVTTSKLDPTKTLTAGMWMERVASRPNGGPKRWPAAATRNFAGSGGGDVAPPHEAVSDAACNTCHVVLRAHDRRQTVQLCKTCHSGAGDYRDPESNESIDLRAMIHRIHDGKNLPSVLAGGKFFIVGFRQTVLDFSDAFFPPTRDPRECAVCHHDGRDSDNWKNKASFVACTSCHDEVRFDGSAGGACALGTTNIQPCNHPAGVTPTTDCSTCHSAGSASLGPDVVHKNPTAEAVKPWKFEIVQVTVGDDRKPVVRFRVTKDGVAQDVKSAPEFTQGSASRLVVDVAWPTAEYTNDGAGFVSGGIPGQGQPVQIDALATSTPVAGQDNVFEVTSPTSIPSQFNDATIVLEGHPALGTGPTAFRVPVPNAIQTVGVGGAPAPARRAVVSPDNCNACHGELSAHGSNRSATPAVCVVCHNPRDTDFVRWTQAGNPADPPEESIDFKVLVHEIHAADIRINPVTILGFPVGGVPSRNEFPAAFPGRTGRCTICHVDDSFQLPLRPEVLDTTTKVGDPAVQGDPAEQRIGRTHAVCLSCHDAVHFDTGTSRPVCNTLVPVNGADCNHTGGAITDDANCASCHGAGAANDVRKVHAIEDQPQ